MQTRIESNARRAARWTLLPAVAAIALLAGLPAARAADQQTTDEEKIYALSQKQAGTGAYAQAPAPAPRRHRCARRGGRLKAQGGRQAPPPFFCAPCRRPRRSFEPAPIDARRHARVLAERRREGARLREADREPDLRHAPVAGQQGLGALDAPAGEIAQRRHAEGLLEDAREVERAQLRDLGEARQQDILRQVLLDIFADARPLPGCEPAADIGLRVRRAAVEPQQLVCQQNAERLAILLLPGRTVGGMRRLELRGDRPQVAVVEVQPRLELGFGETELGVEQGSTRVDVEIGHAREQARLLPAIQAVAARHEAQPAAEFASRRFRQTLDQRLAVVTLAALRHDQEMARGAQLKFVRLAPRHRDGVGRNSVPPRDVALRDIGRRELNWRAGKARQRHAGFDRGTCADARYDWGRLAHDDLLMLAMPSLSSGASSCRS